MADYQLDLRRMLCPMPVIKTQKFVKDLSPGDTVRITATDPGSLEDIPAWCRMYQHSVLETKTESNGEVIVHILVGTGD